ncbi:MAG: prenyltransferase [Candidatus Omnitrophota bacterium]
MSVNFIRALRLPFIVVSILPYVFGAFISRGNFNAAGFFFGLLAVVATHLSANLMNDYADSKSGADWQDRRSFGFFGGSKLIQEGILSEGFYFKAALSFAALAAFCVAALVIILKTFWVIGIFLLIIFLSWAYSVSPFKLVYRRAGELIIFLLFGPALVMGGYFIQTGIFPDLRSFLLSLSLGFLTAGILFANEIPDYDDDCRVGKITAVSFTGKPLAYRLYYGIMGCAFISVALCAGLGLINKFALFSLLLMFPAVSAGRILKRHFEDKMLLKRSSVLTILIHHLTGVILIISLLF